LEDSNNVTTENTEKIKVREDYGDKRKEKLKVSYIN